MPADTVAATSSQERPALVLGRRSLLKHVRLPLLLLLACAVGAVLQVTGALPPPLVWAAVLVAEGMILLAEQVLGSPAAESEPGWTDETAGLACCEIRWAAGYRSSHFEVVPPAQGRGRAEALLRSRPFAWTLRSPPDASVEAQLSEVVRLRSALQADGWEEVAPGNAWYARRFVRRDGEPGRAPGSD